ncbi:MAG: hypothetical protein QW273_03265 [Candidatus Pacearchaeota archaeon]
MKKKTLKKEILFFLLLTFSLAVIFALPEGPSSLNVLENRTKVPEAAKAVNISGGYISTINLTAVIQNVRWKAFVGWVEGKFTLDDTTGSTIFDWSLATINGEVYATRATDNIQWSTVVCAQISDMENENLALNHTNPEDNITRTFTKQPQTHNAIQIGTKVISANSCNGTLNTYQNDNPQDVNFQEILLKDSNSNLIYATFIEKNTQGYDGSNYDFQMIVPENGTPGFQSATAYYLYVELD